MSFRDLLFNKDIFKFKVSDEHKPGFYNEELTRYGPNLQGKDGKFVGQLVECGNEMKPSALIAIGALATLAIVGTIWLFNKKEKGKNSTIKEALSDVDSDKNRKIEKHKAQKDHNSTGALNSLNKSSITPIDYFKSNVTLKEYCWLCLKESA